MGCSGPELDHIPSAVHGPIPIAIELLSRAKYMLCCESQRSEVPAAGKGGFRPRGAERCWGHSAWSTAVRRLFHIQAQGCSHMQCATIQQANSL